LQRYAVEHLTTYRQLQARSLQQWGTIKYMRTNM